MSNFIPVICPTCGSKLDASRDAQRYVCPSCGNEYLLNGNAAVPPTEEADRMTEAERQARAQRAAEAQARIAAETKAAWEQKQETTRREQPFAYWLQENRTLIYAVVAVGGLILMGLVYVIIAMR